MVYNQLVPSMFYCETTHGMKEAILDVVKEMVDEYSNLNIRDYPSIEGRIIGSVPSGTMINIYGTFYGEDSPWYVINYNGIVGYVSGDFVAV